VRHRAHREPTGRCPVGAGRLRPDLQAWCVYLMVVHFVPVQRCRQLVESLTGTAPSASFVHGMLARAAALLDEADRRIRALLTAGLCGVRRRDTAADRAGHPGARLEEGDAYLLVACSSLVTHYLVGGRDLDTFTAMVTADLTGGCPYGFRQAARRGLSAGFA
jgi:transposase